MFVFVLICSAIILWAEHGLYRLAQAHDWGFGLALVSTGCAFWVVFVVLQSAAMFFQMVGLAVLAFVALGLKLSPRRYTAIGSLVTLAIFSWIIAQHALEQQDLRLQYPLEDLRPRLAYEGRVSEAAGSLADLPAASQARLDVLEKRIDESSDSIQAQMRTASLRHIHESHVMDFVNSPGFGVGRSLRPGTMWLRIQPLIDMPLEKPESSDPGTADEAAISLASLELRLTEASEHVRFRELHNESAVDFLNREGFGYLQSDQRVAGFQPHGFRHEVFDVLDDSSRDAKWQVARLELVSLLKHERPMAYVSEFLPRMDELEDAPVRELDEFEGRALASLREGEDVVSAADGNRIRMLGSLRAAKQCIECHQVPRGTLLGAFSYDLRRDPPLPEKPAEAKPKPNA